MSKYSSTVAPMRVMVCTGPVSYTGHGALRPTSRTCGSASLADADGPVTEAFLPSTSPSGFGRNEYYATEQDYLAAVAEAMREEYLAIVEAGFLLQVDDPWLIEILADDGRSDPAERRRRAEEHVEVAQPRAARHPGGPDPAAYLLRAQPRAAAERHPAGRGGAGDAADQRGRLLLRGRQPAAPARVADLGGPELPDGKILLPGLLGHATNYVEHPELIADGICQYASLVGRENVIASADCGFSSRATFAPEVHPTVVWAKFAALAEGAAIATKRLWGAEHDLEEDPGRDRRPRQHRHRPAGQAAAQRPASRSATWSASIRSPTGWPGPGSSAWPPRPSGVDWLLRQDPLPRPGVRGDLGLGAPGQRAALREARHPGHRPDAGRARAAGLPAGQPATPTWTRPTST